jgi:serpin B
MALSGTLLACGDAGGPVAVTTSDVEVDVAVKPLVLAPRSAATADPAVAGRAVAAFGVDVFGAIRATTPAENVAVSPASIAIALAMLEPGTTGDAQTQIRSLLRIDDPATFHSSMNALEQSLEGRVVEVFNEGDDPGEVMMRVANAAYLQQGYPFPPAYLDIVGTEYGPVLNEVDFSADPDVVAHQINDFVADATNDRISDLVADGAIRPETVLALVNALYMKASWLETFEESATTDGPFTVLDGTELTLPMMHGTSASSARGDGWVGATKSYVGGLTAQFILPDIDRFDQIADNLTTVFAEYETNRTSGAPFAMPRFESRFGVELSDALKALGLSGAYVQGGLLGIANDPRLVIDQAVHQTFVAMDEEGTEAAAATVVLIYPTSGPLLEPVPVTLDRPFIYRIIDDQTSATLFIGQVLNPST